MPGKGDLPGPLEKREILFSEKLDPQEKAQWGRRYLQAGKLMDALDFFLEAKSRPDLEKMRSLAIEEGDAFILRSIQRALPELVTEEHWQALGARAAALGKQAFAEQAARSGEVQLPVVDAVIKEDPTAEEGAATDDAAEDAPS